VINGSKFESFTSDLLSIFEYLFCDDVDKNVLLISV